MEALARGQAQREGLPPELQDKVAGAVGILAGMLTPMGVSKKKVVTDVFLNSLFSNPATHSANVLSNALVAAWVPIVERPLAAIASAVEHVVTGAPREVFMGEAPASLFGILSSTIDAIEAGAKAAWTSKSRLPSIMEDVAAGAVGGAERPLYRYGPSGLREVDRALKDDTVIGQGIGLWGTLWRMPTRALGLEDAVFKTFNHQAEIYASAYRDAARSGDLSFANLKRLVENPDPIVSLRADQFALVQTFQRDMSELGPLFSTIGTVGTAIQDVSLGALPVGRLLVPVLRTPTNLAHFVTERTPILGFLSSTLREDIAAGGALRAQAIAKQAGGLLLFGSMAYLANAGILTGQGPTDRALQKQQEELTGRQPYSVKVGDKFYSYDRLSPIGALMGIAADYAEVGGQMPEHGLVEMAQAAGLAVLRNITSKTFVGDTADFWEAAKGDTAALARLVRSGVLKPIPGIMRGLRREFDVTARETDPGAPLEQGEWREVRHIMNEYIAQTPGYSKTLPARQNLWGDPILVPSGYAVDMLSPVFTTSAKNDPAGDEIIRLSKLNLLNIKPADRVIFGRDPEKRAMDEPVSPMDTGIELTATEYQHFVSLAGNGLEIGGLGLHDRLNKIVTTDETYKNANDIGRALIITTHVKDYREAASYELLKTEPGLMEQYKKNQEARGKAMGAPRPAPAGGFNVGGVPQR